MSENINTEASSSAVATKEPNFDSVLHLQMYVLGLELEMKKLVEFAQKNFKSALTLDGDGFKPCIELLTSIKDDEVAGKVEHRILHVIEKSRFITKVSFEGLQKVRPKLAAKISDADKFKFGAF